MTIKTKILEHAHGLFVKQGIRSVTMDELAQSMGMSKRTIYEQFKDKKELVKKVAEFFALSMKARTEDAIQQSDNVVEGVVRILLIFRDVMQNVTPSYFIDMKKHYPMAYEVIAQKNDIRNFDVTTKLVSDGQKQGIFRVEMNVDLVSKFMNTILFSGHENLKDVENLKFGEFERDVLFAYMTGISTEVGKLLIQEEQKKYLEGMMMAGMEMPQFKC